MKISKLNIESYRHLQNLDFDFTYQTGERKGQPLDKICFIGQSATGKTGLLELIYDYNNFALNLEIVEGRSFSPSTNVKTLSGKITFLINNLEYSHSKSEISYKDRVYKALGLGGMVTPLIPNNDKSCVYYFKSNIISDKNIEIFTKNPIDLIEKHQEKLDLVDSLLVDQQDFNSYFDESVQPEMWLFLLQDILHYRKRFTQKMSELIHNGLLGNPKKLDIEYKKWKEENPNELEDFAEKLNPLLEKLNLEVDLVNTEYSIPIKNKKTDEVIPIQNSSTGTKGILLSFFPLFKLDIKESIILIDEPERSLYPDMQMDLMEHYKKLVPDAQIIVATHSPFIAASFEAEERFILYFDEEGKVAVRRGESPIGDDPNDMLKNDFGVNYYNKYGEEAYKKYLDLKEEIANEVDPKKKKELLLEAVKLGDTYNF